MPPSRSFEIVWSLPNSDISTPLPERDSSIQRQGRKKSSSHIPRPPNAFILFRSSFIKSQRVSTDVETNHSTLSKIIGMTWQGLSQEERQVWHDKARVALEEHRKRFPAYAFRPSQQRPDPTAGSGGGTRKRKVREVEPKDAKRCAKIAELLVKGVKGVELNEAIREFDKTHVPEIVTRFEVPITESAFREAAQEQEDIEAERKVEKEPTPVTPEYDCPPTLEEAFVNSQVFYPDPAFHGSEVNSYPCSPVESFPVGNEFYSSGYLDMAPPSLVQAPYASYDRTPFCDYAAQPSPEHDFFAFNVPPGDYIADLMNFEMPSPLVPTWDASAPVIGF